MTDRIAPWRRPRFAATGEKAEVALVMFAHEGLLRDEFSVRAPVSAPVEALDLRHHRADDPNAADWIDGWRTGAFRNIAAAEPIDHDLLDTATDVYTLRLEVADPEDLSYLQLAWAGASALAAAGPCVVLDVYGAAWHDGGEIAALAPERPFEITHEISVICENEVAPGFGHPIHTRGMTKFGRPDLIAGVARDDVDETARILNHLANLLAEGETLEIGQRLRFDGRRTLRVERYEPGGSVPDVILARDGLLLVDVSA